MLNRTVAWAHLTDACTIGAVHPAIRRGELEEPGPLMLNLGRMTPLGSLMGHLVYGVILGTAYDAWPLA